MHHPFEHGRFPAPDDDDRELNEQFEAHTPLEPGEFVLEWSHCLQAFRVKLIRQMLLDNGEAFISNAPLEWAPVALGISEAAAERLARHLQQTGELE